MMKILALSLPLLFFALASNAQRPNDIDGWNKVKWGMTEQDIIKIYKDKVTRKRSTFTTGNFECNLLMEKVKILDDSDVTVDIAFCVDNDTKLLTRVYISNSDSTPFFVDQIIRRLMEKYGKYDDSKLKEISLMKSKFEEYFWYFPSTTINLNIIDINDEPLVSIIYDKSTKADKL